MHRETSAMSHLSCIFNEHTLTSRLKTFLCIRTPVSTYEGFGLMSFSYAGVIDIHDDCGVMQVDTRLAQLSACITGLSLHSRPDLGPSIHEKYRSTKTLCSADNSCSLDSQTGVRNMHLLRPDTETFAESPSRNVITIGCLRLHFWNMGP